MEQNTNPETQTQSETTPQQSQGSKNVAMWNKLAEKNPDGMRQLLEQMNRETTKFFNKVKKLALKQGVIIELEALATYIDEATPSEEIKPT